MRAQTEAPDAVREAVPRRLRELGMTPAALGPRVIVDADRWCLTAVDDPSDLLATAYGSVKPVQSVYLAVDVTGAPCWSWQWSGPARGGSGEYERLCPASAIVEATERISRILALRGEPTGVDG